jgi:hypothetical protein
MATAGTITVTMTQAVASSDQQSTGGYMSRAAIGTLARQYLMQLGAGFVTGTILNNTVNLACREVQRDTNVYRAYVPINLVANKRDYALAGSVMQVYRVTIGTGTNRKRLEPTDMESLDRDEPGWDAGTAGTPTRYYISGGYIGFDPKPHTVAAATTAYMWCSCNAPTLDQAASQPTWLPAAWHDTLAKRTAIDIAGGFDADNPNSPMRQSWLYQEYLQDTAQIRTMASHRPVENSPHVRMKGYSTFRR